jgi:glycine betaine/proline transport system substrate-binding protein
MYHFLKRAIAAGSCALPLLAAGLPPAHAAPESTDPIKIALFDWTSVNLNAKILGTILTKLGYTVE